MLGDSKGGLRLKMGSVAFVLPSCDLLWQKPFVVNYQNDQINDRTNVKKTATIFSLNPFMLSRPVVHNVGSTVAHQR